MSLTRLTTTNQAALGVPPPAHLLICPTPCSSTPTLWLVTPGVDSLLHHLSLTHEYSLASDAGQQQLAAALTLLQR